MRKTTKGLLLSGLLAFGVACIATGCAPNYEQITPEPITYYFELNKYEIENLMVGNSETLIASYQKKDGAILSCYSEDPTVATVSIVNDYNVEIVGYQQGETTVVVEYAEFKKEVAVSVSTNGILPALEFSTNVENGLSVFLNSEYTFDSCVTFNGKTFEDYEISYTLEDATFGSFDGEKLTVGEKCGTTNVTVTASWRGVQSALLTKTFPLTVDVPVNLKVNGSYVNEFMLYTVGSHGGETYETEQPVAFSVTEYGEAVNNYTVTVENHQAGDGSEADVASYQDGKLTALHFGSCNLVVRYNSEYIGEKTFRFNVEVVRPLAVYEDNIEKFSIMDGDLPLEEIFGTSVNLLSATQGKWSLTLDGNKVLGVEAQDKTQMSEETVTLWSDKVGYVVTLEAYQKVLRTEEDFSVLATGTSGEKIKGYYFLDNDVENIAIPYAAESSFDGVFDGNGKTIKVTPRRKGIFGVLNGTLKNVNIVVEDMNASTQYTCVAVCFNMNDNAYVENVNVKVAPASAVNGSFTVFGSMTTKSKLKNVVVEIAENVTAGESTGYGILGYFFSSLMKGAMDVGGTYAGLLQDVYFISNSAKHLMYVMSSANQADNYVVVASNDANNTDLTADAPSVTVVAGAKRYDTIAAMKADKANLDLTSFDENLWDVSSGFPIWKNAMEQYARFLVNGYDTQSIALDNDCQSETIVFDTVMGSYTPTVTVVSGTCLTVNGNVVTARVSGTAIVEAAYTLDGVTYKKQFSVTVDLATDTQTVDGKFYVEQPIGDDSTTPTATTLTWNGLANGTATVMLNGLSVEPVVEGGKISVVWTLFANAGVALGETVSLKVVDASGTAWILSNVMYVTQAIDTEAELRESLNSIRNANYEGQYYVLAKNIECTDTTLLGGKQAWGNLKSTFDGQGNYVNNLYVGEWGIFGANVNGGKLKNIAFINVNSTVENPVLIGTGGGKISGGIDNVYVSATCDGLTLYQTAPTVYNSWGYFNAVVLENCAGLYAGNSNVTGTLSTNSLYMISETETSVAAGRYATNTTKTNVETYGYLKENIPQDGAYGGVYWYASYELMKAEVQATAVKGSPTIAPFNDCWDLTNGYPVWKNLPTANA